MTPFARTKIQPPRPRSAFVERANVQTRLSDALRTRRLVLLCAPAGYGKTTLLAQEIARLPASTAVAWISADEGDDVQRLLECMLAALEPFDPPWRTAPESLAKRVGASADESRQVSAEIINTLAACEAAHGVIVFDDVHRVDDAAFFRFLDGLLERLVEGWCVALTSRVEPPLALARLRAADELVEFRQLQLQFAREEARSLAASSGVDRTVADRLFDRTLGWPAGLRIALGAIQGSAGAGFNPDRALRASERPLFEFLLAEVLARVPTELRDFLLVVSVLPELDAERCAAVSGRSDAAALLDAIERLGLFVDVLDAPVHTLRLHDLFREALQQHLQREDPAALVEARRRAADTETDPIRRIGLLLEAGDSQQAAELAFDHLPRLIVTAGAGSALHLVSRFPAAVRERAPELAFVRALASWAQHWDFPSMLTLMQRAQHEFDTRGDVPRRQLASAYVATALIAMGRLEEGGACLDALRGETLSPVAQAIVLNAEAWVAIEACRYAEVAPLMSRLLDLLHLCDRIDLWYQTTPPLRMPGLPGITPVLERHAELLLQLAGDTPTPLRTIAVQTQAWCALWRGSVAEARRTMARAMDDAQWSGQTGAVRAHELAFNAVLGMVTRDAAAALAAAEARWQAFSPTASAWHRYILSLFGARIAAGCNELAALRRALLRIEANRPPSEPATAATLTRPLELPLMAQLAWLEGRPDDAVRAWEEALAIEGQIDVMGQGPEVRVRLARALVQRGDARAAGRVLAPVFERARIDGPGGALLAGDALAHVAVGRWRGALPAADAADLRRWWQAIATGGSGTPDPRRPAGVLADDDRGQPPTPARGEALTGRELEVLARIAAGDSNKLIARAFDLSLHTVKRHVANILGKLDVQTRGQAAAWYRVQAR